MLQGVPEQGLPQPPAAPNIDFGMVVGLTAAMVLLIVAAAVVVALARRYLLEKPYRNEDPFDHHRLLRQYEELRDRGAISEEEYQRTRAKLLGLPEAPSDSRRDDS